MSFWMLLFKKIQFICLSTAGFTLISVSFKDKYTTKISQIKRESSLTFLKSTNKYSSFRYIANITSVSASRQVEKGHPFTQRGFKSDDHSIDFLISSVRIHDAVWWVDGTKLQTTE